MNQIAAEESVLEQLSMDGNTIDIRGECPGVFKPVLDAFVANFRARRELGASYCVYLGGRKVVDIWGGHRDPERKTVWTGDTVVGMASVVKGMLALSLHMLADQGKLSYDAPVAEYWPEFAQHGKERITVRQAISHHAGIPFCDACQPGDFFRWDRFVEALSRQAPEWEPGTRGCYHTLTIFPILGQLIEAASGLRPWDYFRERVTNDLGIDYHFRLQAADIGRFSADVETEKFLNNPSAATNVWARFFRPVGDMSRVADFLSAEEIARLPFLSSGGSARGVARFFAFAAMNGELDGVRIYSPRTIDLMTEVQWDTPCPVWGAPFRTALGLLVNNDFFYVGPNPKTFGTAGAGGSFGMADRERGLSAAYALNRWWPALALGERAKTLIDATYACL